MAAAVALATLDTIVCLFAMGTLATMFTFVDIVILFGIC
jgi:hypothetical protein